MIYPLTDPAPTCRGEITFRVGRNAREKIKTDSRKGTAFTLDGTGIQKRKDYMLNKGLPHEKGKDGEEKKNCLIGVSCL